MLERGKNKKKSNPELQNLLFSRAGARQQRGQSQAGCWCRGSQPPGGLHDPASPPLPLSFLIPCQNHPAACQHAVISGISFRRGFFSAPPPLLFSPQTQTRDRAVLWGVRAGLPRIRPSPALTPKRCRRGTGGLWLLVGMFLVSSVHGATRTRVYTSREPHSCPIQRDEESRAKEMGLGAPSAMQASEEGVLRLPFTSLFYGLKSSSQRSTAPS